MYLKRMYLKCIRLSDQPALMVHSARGRQPGSETRKEIVASSNDKRMYLNDDDLKAFVYIHGEQPTVATSLSAFMSTHSLVPLLLLVLAAPLAADSLRSVDLLAARLESTQISAHRDAQKDMEACTHHDVAEIVRHRGLQSPSSATRARRVSTYACRAALRFPSAVLERSRTATRA